MSVKNRLVTKLARKKLHEASVVIDTNIIIDGRILPVIDSGFFTSRIVIAQFIIDELALLLSSRDAYTAERAQNAQSTLNTLLMHPMCLYVAQPRDKTTRIDDQLLNFCHDYGSSLCTMDRELMARAKEDQVKLLDMYALSWAMKPLLLPGDTYTLKLLKLGEQKKQAIGYSEDGSLIVVEAASHLIGKTVRVTISKLLDTQTMRMYIAELS